MQVDDEDEQWFTLMQDNPVNSSKDEFKQPQFEFLPNQATSYGNEPKVSRVNLNGAPPALFDGSTDTRQKANCFGHSKNLIKNIPDQPCHLQSNAY